MEATHLPGWELSQNFLKCRSGWNYRSMSGREKQLVLGQPYHADSNMKHYVSSELVKYIDTHYSTIKDRKGRAVTGLSMGGHGGMWLSIRHKDVFGAGGSTSGGVDIRPFPSRMENERTTWRAIQKPSTMG